MIDIIDKAIANLHEQIATFIEFKKLFMIATLLGMPPKSIKGKITMQITETGSGSYHNHKPWLRATYSIRVEDGEPQVFALKDVPTLLWPEEWQVMHARLK
jgi:hypothetical protein